MAGSNYYLNSAYNSFMSQTNGFVINRDPYCPQINPSGSGISESEIEYNRRVNPSGNGYYCSGSTSSDCQYQVFPGYPTIIARVPNKYYSNTNHPWF